MIKLGFIYLSTQNPDKLIKFYEKLGFVFHQNKLANDDVYHTAEFGGSRLIFTHDKLAEVIERETDIKITNSFGSLIGFEVDNVDEIIRKFIPKEIVQHPVMSPRFGYTAILKDPDGRVFNLYQKNKGKIGD